MRVQNEGQFDMFLDWGQLSKEIRGLVNLDRMDLPNIRCKNYYYK